MGLHVASSAGLAPGSNAAAYHEIGEAMHVEDVVRRIISALEYLVFRVYITRAI